MDAGTLAGLAAFIGIFGYSAVKEIISAVHRRRERKALKRLLKDG